MPKVKISTFEPISYTLAYHDENDFSDWLVKNLDILNDLLGISLEDGKREERQGRKKADIVARISDVEEDAYAIIENQMEESDHKHLGQLITYSGIHDNVQIAIWIAREFDEEHKRALEWLNENVSEKIQFYAIKYSVLDFKPEEKKIHFEIVARPNTEVILQKQISQGNLKPHRKARLKLYQKAMEKYNEMSNEIISKSPSINNWFNMKRTTKFQYSWSHYRQDRHSIYTSVRIKGDTQDDRRKIFLELRKFENEINKNLGEGVEWDDADQKTKGLNYDISTVHYLTDRLELIDNNEMEQVAEWMANSLLKFENTFGKYE